jgi:DNA primase
VPLIDFRSARREIRLAAVLELLGWRCCERNGFQVRGPCPVHGSSSPRSRSLSVHLGRGVWQCFRCGASGNALELWARVRGEKLYPATLELYRQLGRTPPWLPPALPSTRERRSNEDMRDP